MSNRNKGATGEGDGCPTGQRKAKPDVNLITHAIIGVALSEALMLNPITVILGAIIPDLDYVIGIQHRTITHSLLFVIITCLVVWKFKGKRSGYALLIGLASHLMLDTITPMGVPLLWPIGPNYSFNLASWDDLLVNGGLILGAIIVIINKDSISEFLFSLKKGRAFWGVNIFMISWLAILFFYPVTGCNADLMKINLISLLPGENNVLVNATICSEINLTNSSSGNEYQVFKLCDETSNITVWKGLWVLENNLSNGDVILLCGKITHRFGQPEIYYINSVIK